MIEILHYERVNRNKIIGHVDIKFVVNGVTMIIRKIAHIQSGDRRWFNLPTFSRDKPDGTQQYFKYWQFEFESYNAQLLENLNEKVKEFCDAQGIEQIKPLNFDSIGREESKIPF